MAGRVAPANGLENLDLHRAAESGLEDRLLRRTRAVTVQVVLAGRPEAGGGAVAALRHGTEAHVDVRPVLPALEGRLHRGHDSGSTALAELRDVRLEGMAVEAAAAAPRHQLALVLLTELRVQRIHQVGDPV